MNKLTFSDMDHAIKGIIDEALTELGKPWKNDQRVRQFLYDALATDPTVLEVLKRECVVKDLLCSYYSLHGD